MAAITAGISLCSAGINLVNWGLAIPWVEKLIESKHIDNISTDPVILVKGTSVICFIPSGFHTVGILCHIQIACKLGGSSLHFRAVPLKCLVIYEAPVEGRTSRLMAIIEDYDDLDMVGPVRSSRGTSCRPPARFLLYPSLRSNPTPQAVRFQDQTPSCCP